MVYYILEAYLRVATVGNRKDLSSRHKSTLTKPVIKIKSKVQLPWQGFNQLINGEYPSALFSFV